MSDIAILPRLNLKNTPPYLYGIVLEVSELLGVISRRAKIEDPAILGYLEIFTAKFSAQCKKIVFLFRQAGQQIFFEDSSHRRELTRLTLVLSHINNELQTYFKDGTYKEHRIAKPDARDFWERSFGKKGIIVNWNSFFAEFKKVHPVRNFSEEQALRKTVDLLENDHVSTFEFDIFTRLFQPWGQIINNWNVIAITHPGYYAFITFDDVQKILDKFIDKPGSYVFRLSCTKLGQWAIGCVTRDRQIVQTIPSSGKSLYETLIEGASSMYLYPNGQDRNPDISKQIEVNPREHVKVTKEQFDIYSTMDSLFEKCKICDDNVKSIRIDPCGHLMCSTCLQKWMVTGQGRKGEAATCPFCREQVISTSNILVKPFDPFDEEAVALSNSTSNQSTAGSAAPLVASRSSGPSPETSRPSSAKPTPNIFTGDSDDVDDYVIPGGLVFDRAKPAAGFNHDPQSTAEVNTTSSRFFSEPSNTVSSVGETRKGYINLVENMSTMMQSQGSSYVNVALQRESTPAAARESTPAGQSAPMKGYLNYNAPLPPVVSPGVDYENAPFIPRRTLSVSHRNIESDTVPPPLISVPRAQTSDEVTHRFLAMGFDTASIQKALRISGFNEAVALDILISFSSS